MLHNAKSIDVLYILYKWRHSKNIIVFFLIPKIVFFPLISKNLTNPNIINRQLSYFWGRKKRIIAMFERQKNQIIQNLWVNFHPQLIDWCCVPFPSEVGTFSCCSLLPSSGESPGWSGLRQPTRKEGLPWSGLKRMRPTETFVLPLLRDWQQKLQRPWMHPSDPQSRLTRSLIDALSITKLTEFIHYALSTLRPNDRYNPRWTSARGCCLLAAKWK